MKFKLKTIAVFVILGVVALSIATDAIASTGDLSVKRGSSGHAYYWSAGGC